MTGKAAESTVIEALSAHVLNTRFEDIDRRTVDSAKDRIIDTIGCAIAGATEPENRALVDVVKGWGGKPEATIIALGVKAPMHEAAMLNSIMCRSFDFEAMSGEVAGKYFFQHISGSTVPAALAVAEARHLSGKELIATLVLGDDIANRVVLSYDYDFLGGFDGSATNPNFGATAIAGRALGLNQFQLRNAFGIVLNFIGGSLQNIWDGAAAFKLGQGMAARNGIFAAQMAKAGWTGPRDPLSSTYGFYRLYTHGCTHPDMLTQDLGRVFFAENSFKPYPCCRATHMTIDVALKLVSQYDIKAGEIEEITIYGVRRALENFVGKPFVIRDFPHGDAIFSLRYTCATALLRKSVRPEHFTEKAMRDPEVQSLINKIKLEAFPDNKIAGNMIRVKMKDGREFSESTTVASGDTVKKPLSHADVVDKFMNQVDFSHTITRDNAARALEQLENLENLDNIDRIFNYLEK